MIKKVRWKACALGTCALLMSAASTLPAMAVYAQSSAPEDSSTSAVAVSDSGSSESSSDTSSSGTNDNSATSNIASGTGQTFTPDGNGTLVDSATSADNKHFYTIQTPAGNYFYLIVDGDRDSDNVYMTSLITEQEMLSLIAQQSEDGTATGSSSASIIPSEEDVFGDGSGFSEDDDGFADTEGESSSDLDAVEKAKKASASQNAIYIIVLVIAVLCVGGFFLYKYIKEKNGDYDDDFEDDEDYEEEEEYENEDGEGQRVEQDEDESGEERDVKKNEHRPREVYRYGGKEEEVEELSQDRFRSQERSEGIKHTTVPTIPDTSAQADAQTQESTAAATEQKPQPVDNSSEAQDSSSDEGFTSSESDGFDPSEEESFDPWESGEISGAPEENQEAESNNTEEGEKEYMENTQNTVPNTVPNTTQQSQSQNQGQSPVQSQSQSAPHSDVQPQNTENTAAASMAQAAAQETVSTQETAATLDTSAQADNQTQKSDGFDPSEADSHDTADEQSYVEVNGKEILPGAEGNSEDDYEDGDEDDEDPVDIIMQKMSAFMECAARYKEVSAEIIELKKKLDDLNMEQAEKYGYIKNFGALAERL